MKKIPSSFQSFFWSVRLEDIDLEKDKVYIINQVLSYGGLEELRWLFKTYRAPAFNFVKRILLDIKEPLLEERYVINTPREGFPKLNKS